MKKSIIFTGFLGLFSLVALTACDSNKEKTAQAEVNLTDANSDLNEFTKKLLAKDQLKEA
jgi:hypothetical protein